MDFYFCVETKLSQLFKWINSHESNIFAYCETIWNILAYCEIIWNLMEWILGY